MIDIPSITSQIKKNCNISDAKYWGFYSPCGLLLRMRDLFRVERNLRPWGKVNTNRIKAWIDKKEYAWEELEELDYQKIQINGKEYSPFDINKINKILNRHGLVYGAGYGHMLKPLFFLSEQSEKFTEGQYKVYVTGRELARCLSSAPAMVREKTIFAREQTMTLFFWDKFEEMGAIKCNGALYNAFAEYGISKGIGSKKVKEHITKIVRDEIATYIYHEVGETSQRRYLGEWWKKLLIKFPHTRTELFLRALKDVLSNTCNSGMLAHIIKNKKAGSLGFYIALFGGYRRNIIPEMQTAYEEFVRTGDWGLIEKARGAGHRRAMGYVKRLKGMVDEGKVSEKAIENIVIV